MSVEPYSSTLFEAVIEDLSAQGYSIRENFLSAELVNEVRLEIESLSESGHFRPATVGKAFNSSRELHLEIRGDGTSWFSENDLSPTQAKIWEILGHTQNELNRALFLGLWDFEGHYAVYTPGAFYRAHLDRFKNDSRRTVSVVFFFNADWVESDGGSLVLDLPDGPKKILPQARTAVFFLSDKIVHEVSKTHRRRLSFAGWFRTRDDKAI